MNAEEWRPVLGYEGEYEVSDQGRVRTLKARRFHHVLSTGHTDDNGYHWVCLWRDAVGTTLRVHRLVLEAFSGPRPKGIARAPPERRQGRQLPRQSPMGHPVGEPVRRGSSRNPPVRLA